MLRSLERCAAGSLELVADGHDAVQFRRPGDARLRATVAVHNDRFFQRALLGGDMALGEVLDGRRLVVARPGRRGPPGGAQPRPARRAATAAESLSRLADTLRHRLRGNSVPGSRRNIGAHYDLSNDFFRLFLDRSMMYSCACYRIGRTTRSRQAQFQKLDRICRKLRPGPGGPRARDRHRLGRVRRARGRATTAAASPPRRSAAQQHDYASERFADSVPDGTASSCSVEDYRQPRAGSSTRLVSIEMFEAVGLATTTHFFGSLRPPAAARWRRCCCRRITINEQTFRGLPPAQRLDPEVHLPRLGARLGERDSALAGARDLDVALPRRGHRHALRAHAGGVAGALPRRATECGRWASTIASSACGTTTSPTARARFWSATSAIFSSC